MQKLFINSEPKPTNLFSSYPSSTMNSRIVLLLTTNAHKVSEYKSNLDHYGVDVEQISEFEETDLQQDDYFRNLFNKYPKAIAIIKDDTNLYKQSDATCDESDWHMVGEPTETPVEPIRAAMEHLEQVVNVSVLQVWERRNTATINDNNFEIAKLVYEHRVPGYIDLYRK
jgi:hypothetical protein